MWTQLTLPDGSAIMVNLEKYGNILRNKACPTGSILYQTDAGDDLGLKVVESFERLTEIIDKRRPNHDERV